KLFWDEENRGFFFYGSDAEQLIARPKEVYDGAIPSGNSVMAYNLIRHGRLTGSGTFDKYAELQLQAFSASINRYPSGHTFFLCAGQLALGNSMEIVIAGGENEEVFGAMVQQVQRSYLPFTVFIVNSKEQRGKLKELAPAHEDKVAINGKSALYVCENFTCQQPIFALDDVKQRLS
ncbi:MAG: thioredoxin domain-containing protein, partial [Bacilli bacterium]